MKPVTLRVICEGPTERNFITQVLGPHLRPFAVFTKPENLGGIKAYDTLRKAIQSDLGRSRAHEYVTTIFDLYALPNYPGDPKGQGITGARRAEHIEAAMAKGLNHPRFLPYIQVHEFEALVFVDLDQLPAAFPDGEADGAPERLRRSIGDLAPEDIDDGAQTAPSKRLIKEVEAYGAQKPIAGPLIAARIGLARLRAACPHLDQWVRKLEALAG